jgi:hypothetical protein
MRGFLHALLSLACLAGLWAQADQGAAHGATGLRLRPVAVATPSGRLEEWQGDGPSVPGWGDLEDGAEMGEARPVSLRGLPGPGAASRLHTVTAFVPTNLHSRLRGEGSLRAGPE